MHTKFMTVSWSIIFSRGLFSKYGELPAKKNMFYGFKPRVFFCNKIGVERACFSKNNNKSDVFLSLLRKNMKAFFIRGSQDLRILKEYCK